MANTVSAAELIERWNQDITELYQPHAWLRVPRPWLCITPRHTEHRAASIIFWLKVDADLLGCPDYVRRAIVAHECGHHRNLHSLIPVLTVPALSTIDGVLTRIGAPPHSMAYYAGVAVGLALLGVTTVILSSWKEYKADAYAAQKVGTDNVVAALSWLGEDRGTSVLPKELERRIKRLRST